MSNHKRCDFRLRNTRFWRAPHLYILLLRIIMADTTLSAKTRADNSVPSTSTSKRTSKGSKTPSDKAKVDANNVTHSNVLSGEKTGKPVAAQGHKGHTGDMCQTQKSPNRTISENMTLAGKKLVPVSVDKDFMGNFIDTISNKFSSALEKDLVRMKKLQKAQKQECRRAYHTYMMAIIDPTSGMNSKKLYSYIKSLRKDSTGVGPLKDQHGTLQGDPKQQADILNSQFASVFSTDDPDTEPPELDNDIDPAPYPNMQPITIHVNGVAKLLRNLKAHKATGPDQVPAKLLKEAADQLAPMLRTIFQASYDQESVPDAWRHADVVPAYKKGDHSIAANYRPISLTSISCKLMEHILQSSIMRHLDTHGILTDSQHGFRKRRSCDTQLLLAIDDLQRALDNNLQVDAILLDFSKAFDKVSHARLAMKLEHYGITDHNLGWIK